VPAASLGGASGVRADGQAGEGAAEQRQLLQLQACSRQAGKSAEEWQLPHKCQVCRQVGLQLLNVMLMSQKGKQAEQPPGS
jgi:hypothetical protein